MDVGVEALMDAEPSTTTAGVSSPGPTTRPPAGPSPVTPTADPAGPGVGRATPDEPEVADGAPASSRRSLRARRRSADRHGELELARKPLPGPRGLRAALSVVLGGLSLLTVGGAVLMLLLWQQERAAGVLSTQLDRTWDLFGLLGTIERWVAFAAVPIAMAWAATATVNVRRATGHRRNPVVSALSIPVGVIGAWAVGDRVVAESADWLGQAAGLVLQAVFLAVPLLVLERVAASAEARHGPLRLSYVVGVAYLAHLQFLGGLSTIDRTDDPAEWGRIGAYLVIGALLQVLGALSATEAGRAVEDGTAHRYELRNRFGESLLAQAAAST